METANRIGNSTTRRRFIAAGSALLASSFFGLPMTGKAKPAPEINRIRMLYSPAVCGAVALIAEKMLLAEGIEVEWVKDERGMGAKSVAQGLADVAMWDAPSTIAVMDTGDELTALAGIHAGCWELFGNSRINTLKDLKGKTVAIWGSGAGDHIMLSSMLAYVGLDPRKDVNWIVGSRSTSPMNLFIEGKVDAFMGFAPQPQEVRRKKIGHVILDTAQDRPWSQYFCCIVIARRDFVRTHPVATKQILRAYLKAADVCAQDPERTARLLVDKEWERRYDIGLEVLKSLPWNHWRHANPEDTLRFYALRLHEVRMIKTAPQQLIAQSTDWRFLNELKRELKA